MQLKFNELIKKKNNNADRKKGRKEDKYNEELSQLRYLQTKLNAFQILSYKSTNVINMQTLHIRK